MAAKEWKPIETDRVKLKPEASANRADRWFINGHGEVVEVRPIFKTIDWDKFNKSKNRHAIKGASKFRGKTKILLDVNKIIQIYAEQCKRDGCEVNDISYRVWIKWDSYQTEFMERVKDLDKL